jgi:hypothetical protein
MKRKYSPQRSDNEISYQFDGEKIIVNLNGQTDAIDLTGVDEYPLFEDGNKLTTLPIDPIISVRTVDGKKQVELLKFHKVNAPESERFGFDWEEV